MDLGVFQETKVSGGEYMHSSMEYNDLVDDTPSSHRGVGVSVFYHDASHFQVEAYQSHGMNVESFQVASVGRR